MHHVRQEDLPFVGSVHEFVGAHQGDTGVSVFLFHGKPGSGPGPHRHAKFSSFVKAADCGPLETRLSKAVVATFLLSRPERFTASKPSANRHWCSLTYISVQISSRRTYSPGKLALRLGTLARRIIVGEFEASTARSGGFLTSAALSGLARPRHSLAIVRPRLPGRGCRV